MPKEKERSVPIKLEADWSLGLLIVLEMRFFFSRLESIFFSLLRAV